MLDLASVQAFMRQHRLDGWLLYDFRGNNAVFAQLLAGQRWTTRRVLLYVPASGPARLLVHAIDAPQFAGLEIQRDTYLSWQDLLAWLTRIVPSAGRVAMEYVPGGILPVVSIVDAGTVELVRALGVEVVSSANLVQVCVASWSPAAHQAHLQTSGRVTRIKDQAFDLIRQRVGSGRPITEYDVQQHIASAFLDAGLEATEPPIVAVNAHSGDPHYEPTPQNAAPIRPGDWVLIDLWARQPGDQHIYSDITWVGFVGDQVPAKHREVFEIVRTARDRVVERAVEAWKAGQRLQGWQLDEVARQVIIAAGYERYIRHRTGHSLSPGPAVHGLGVNLDNLETHDTREVLAGIGFSVEPGIYLPEFGVRLEINVFVDPDRGPTVTSCVQEQVVTLA